MKLSYILFAAAFGLAACGGSATGRSGDGDGGTDPGDVDAGTDVPIDVSADTCPADFICAGDIRSVTYNSVDDELYLTGLPFDDDPTDGVYVFTGITVNGFKIYENTNPAIFSRYLAMHRSTSGGEITIGLATIEGYQDFGYRGAWLEIDSLASSIPTGDLVEYLGDYAGFMVFSGSGEQYVTEGDLTLQVDFTDSTLRGTIDNRRILDPGDSYNEVFVPGTSADPDTSVDGTLPNLILNDTAITDGSFSGTVNSYDGPDTFESGTYQGYFGGADASVVGGIVEAVAPGFSEGDEDTGNIISLDTGVFIGECAGSITGCAPTSP